MEPSRSRLPLIHFSLLASLCSARWRDDSRGFLWCPASRPPRRGPLAIVVYAHDETAMSPEQEDWEINGIDTSGLDAQVAEGKLLACCICCLVLCSAYSANLVQIATPRTPRPALVLTPVTADEVRAYVVCCRNHGLTVRARSGGHNYEGLSYRSLRSSGDGEEAARFAVVDVAALWVVRLDAARGVACTKARATRAVRSVVAAGLPPPPPISSPPGGCAAVTEKKREEERWRGGRRG
ncbi:berberine bridge enzyme-like 17 [Oryza glaberrima]|uniref:berberine bridge enzyme-like 17 n=1 Tax=Oryza glaberrima TaxID=4538 RepID=UPI00224C2350|nr:berberine bridge enzyme-like 17 [Oryza glaberrima]